MPLYDYKCELCNDERTVRLTFKDREVPECCGIVMKRRYNSAPNTVVTPKHQAVKDKMSYYGIKNIQTGDGITKDTDVSIPPGITISDSEDTV